MDAFNCESSPTVFIMPSSFFISTRTVLLTLRSVVSSIFVSNKISAPALSPAPSCIRCPRTIFIARLRSLSVSSTNFASMCVPNRTSKCSASLFAPVEGSVAITSPMDLRKSVSSTSPSSKTVNVNSAPIRKRAFPVFIFSLSLCSSYSVSTARMPLSIFISPGDPDTAGSEEPVSRSNFAIIASTFSIPNPSFLPFATTISFIRSTASNRAFTISCLMESLPIRKESNISSILWVSIAISAKPNMPDMPLSVCAERKMLLRISGSTCPTSTPSPSFERLFVNSPMISSTSARNSLISILDSVIVLTFLFSDISSLISEVPPD